MENVTGGCLLQLPLLLNLQHSEPVEALCFCDCYRCLVLVPMDDVAVTVILEGFWNTAVGEDLSTDG